MRHDDRNSRNSALRAIRYGCASAWALGASIAALAMFAAVSAAFASGPSSNRILNYQLRLTDSSGVAVADGTKNVKLTIYTASTSGTQLYTACSSDGTATGTPTAVVATFLSGTTTVLIGDTTITCASGTAVAIPATLFDNTALYLGVTVASDAEMTPRKRIVATGYSLNADKLDNLDTSNSGGSNAFVPVTDSSGNLTLTKNLTVDSTTLSVDATNHRVGIGDASPSALFTVGSGSLFQVNSSGAIAAVVGITSSAAYSQTAGNFSISGSGTFGTGTGAISLNGDTTIAANKNFTLASGTGNFAQTKTSTSTTGATETAAALTFSDTGIVTTGTDTTNGSTISVTRTGATGGTINTFGQTITVTGDTGGTSTATGLSVTASGADTNYAALFNGGNVGIGTSAPVTTLHVNGIGSFGDSVTVANANRALNLASTNAVMRILRVDASNAPAVELISRTSADGTDVAYWDMYAQPSNASFRIRDRVGSDNDRFTILHSSGNVGIGEDNPSALLSVGSGSLFQVNSSGAIAAVVGITSSAAYSQTAGNFSISGSGTFGTGTGAISLNGATTMASGTRFNAAAHAANAGLRLPTNAGAPSAVTGTTEGDVVWDSTGDALYVYNGSSFSNVSSGSITLQQAYDNDVDGGNVTITTNSTDGALVIAGNQQFQVTTTGNSIFDTKSLVVDATNHRVGIGNTAPVSTLHVYDSTATTGTTKLTLQAGAGQSTTDLLEVKDNSGNLIDEIASTGMFAARMDTTNAVVMRAFPLTGSGKNRVIDMYDASDVNNSGEFIAGIVPTTGWAHATLSGSFIQSGKNGTGTAQPLYIMAATDVFHATPNITVLTSGNVGINDTAPAALFTVGASDAFQVNSSGRVLANVGASGSGNLAYSFVGDTGTGLYRASASQMRFQTGGSDRVTIDSSGRVGMGTTSPTNILSAVKSGGTAIVDLTSYASALSDRSIFFTQTAEGTEASPSNVASGDNLGEFIGAGYGGGAFRNAVSMSFGVDTGTVSATSLPSFIYFETTPNGSISRSERMRISSAGNVGIGDTSPAALLTVGNGDLFQVNSSGAIAAVVGITSSAAYSQTAGNFSISGTGTFGTGTGAISLNGDTTIAANKNFTLASGTGNFAQTKTSTSTTGATETAAALTFSDTGIVTTGTDTTNGSTIAVTRTGATGGTINTFGQTINLITDNAGAGTSTATGLSVTLDGNADTNYAALFNGGSVGIGTSTPSASLEISKTTQDVPTGSADFRVTNSFNDYAGINIKSTATGGREYLIASSSNGNGNGGGRLLFYDATASATRMTIDSSGNVGIGTPSPDTLLSLSRSANDAFTGIDIVNGNAGSSSQARIDIGHDTSSRYGSVIYVNSDDHLDWSSAGSGGINIQASNAAGFITFKSGGANERMRILSTGNVGIGDSTPLGLLTVGANDAFQVNSSGRVLANVGASGSGNLAYSFVGDTGTGLYRSAANEMRFQTNASDRVTIDSSGRVGIGATAPQAALEVVGSTGTVVARNSTASSYASFRAFNDQNSSVRSLESGYTGSTFAGPSLTNGTTGEIGYISTTGAFPLEFGTSNTARMTIISTGNIGIGDITPAALLTVGNGDLFQVNSSGAIAAVVGITSSAAYSQTAGNFTISGTGTFGTGTGAISLNGDTTIAANKNFTLASGTGNFAQTKTSTSTTGATETAAALTFSDTGIVTTGTDTTNGKTISVTRTGATGGTINTFGQTINLITDNAGAGTSTATGLSVTLDGNADTNYALLTSGGNVGIGVSTPAALFSVGTSSAFQVDTNGLITTTGSTLAINNASPVISTNSTGTATVFNTNATTVSIAGAATTAVNIGANGGTATIANPTVTLSNATTLNINGASPTLASSSTGTLTLFNTAITAASVLGAATGNIDIAGGSGSTGCTIVGNTGALTCSGNITGSTSGTVGFFSRSGTTVSTATSGDNLTVTGSGAFTTGTGTTTINGTSVVLAGAPTTIDMTGAGTLSINTTTNRAITVGSGLFTTNGALTATGLVTANAGATVTGAAVNLNAGSNFAVNVGTGSNNTSVAIGGGSDTAAVDSTTWDVSTSGDLTSAETALNGSTTTSGAGTTSTALAVTAGANFDTGNYVKVTVATGNCATGLTTCYAKITGGGTTNNLTISPALTWPSGATVTEVHLSEIGGVDLTQALANRYGMGYFINGISTGNATTVFTDGLIDTSASVGTLHLDTTNNQPITTGSGLLTAGGALTINGTLTGNTGLTMDSATATNVSIGATNANGVTIGRNAAGSTTINSATALNVVNGAIQTANTTRLSNGGALSNITGYTQASGAFSATGLSASSLSTTSADLTLSTVTSGTLALTSAGAANISAAANSTANYGANRIDFTSSQFNTTSTGINSTAIGATTTSTGAFTTLTNTGNATIGTGSSSANTMGAGASSTNTIGSGTTPGALTLHGATTLDNTFTVSGANLTSLGGNLTVTGTSWTATPTISGLVTATSGLTSNGTFTLNAANNFTKATGAGTFSFDSNSTTAPFILTASGAVTTGNTAYNLTSSATTGTSLGITANATTSGTPLSVSTSSLTTGKAIDIQVSGTAAGASQTGLNILTAGATSTNAITSYGAQISNTHTNATSGTNVGLLVSASGATTANYGLLVTNGNVGVGTSAPTSKLEVVGDIVSTGTSWTTQSTTGIDNNWDAVVYGNGTFVATSNTGTGNRVMTSPDGVTWTTRSSTSDSTWYGLTYGNGLFVAVADENVVMTSPDGITWTQYSTGGNGAGFGWNSITYGNGTFVGIADGSTHILTSTDGRTWSTSSGGLGTFAGQSIAYLGGQFIATAYTSGVNSIATSSNGTTWTIQTHPTCANLSGVTYGNGLYVVGGTNCILTSPDGVTWTQQTATGGLFSSAAYANGLFVVLSSSNSVILTSPDGVTWTSRTNPTGHAFSGLTFGNGTFVAVAQTGSGTRAMTSGKDAFSSTYIANNTLQGGWTIKDGLTVAKTETTTTAATQTALPLSFTDTGAVSTGTDVTNGSTIAVTRTGGSGTGVFNTFGQTITVTGDTGGTSTATGLSLTVSGADTNYALITSGGNVGIGDAAPSALFTVGSGSLFQVNSSGAIAAVVGITSSSDYSQTAGNFTISGTGTFGTGTGAISLNGDTTLAAAKSLTKATGAGTFSFDSNSTTVPFILTASGAVASGSTAYNFTSSATTGTSLGITANSATTGAPLLVSTSSLTSGRGISVAITGTAAATNQTGVNISVSGASATSAVTSYGEQISNTHTNATSGTNVGLLVSASGATTANYGLLVTNGSVGIGTSTPSNKLEVVGDITSKGTSWTSRTSAADIVWSGVAYGNGLFVAVSNTGSGNRVMTSPDGVNWTTRTTAPDNAWNGITYGNGLFVAVSSTAGTGNQIMTSPDGITWTSRTSAANNQWYGIAYGNGLFVATSVTGTGNEVMTSPDGITWTSRTNAADLQWYGLTYGNGLFVAVASSGTGNRVMTSPDGITWTSRTSAADNSWNSVVYGNGLFVAVSFDNTGGNEVMTSPDGITWTSRTEAAANQWRGITYGNGLFVAVSFNGANRVMTSPDGITWVIRTSAAANTWGAVTYGNGLFAAVAGSGSGNRVMTSGKIDYVPFSANNLFQGGLTAYDSLNATKTQNSTTAATETLSALSFTDTGAVSTGTDVTNGSTIAVTRTGGSGTGVFNTFGQSITVTGDTGGTSTATGLSISASGADTNYALITSGGNVGIGVSTPSALFSVGTSSAFQVDASGNLTFATSATTADFASGTNGNTFIWKVPQKATTGACASAGAEGVIIKTTGGTQVGHVCIDGPTSGTPNKLRYYAEQFSATSTDLAETYSTHEADGIEPGDVVELDPAGNLFVRKTSGADSGTILGVISTSPGLALSGIDESTGSADTSHGQPVALKGRVPVKVSLENGPIAVGDWLTSSSVPGVAMKATASGMVIGRALDTWSGSSTVGITKIRVFLEVGYWNGAALSAANAASEHGDLFTLNPDGAIDFHGNGAVNLQFIRGIASIEGANGAWSIDATGKLIAKEIVADKVQSKAFTVEADDQHQTVGEGTIDVGNSSVTVTNPTVKATDKLFVTFYGNTQGSWWISDREDGRFIISLQTPAATDLKFEYWVVGVVDNRTPVAGPPAPVVTPPSAGAVTSPPASAVTPPTAGSDSGDATSSAAAPTTPPATDAGQGTGGTTTTTSAAGSSGAGSASGTADSGSAATATQSTTAGSGATTDTTPTAPPDTTGATEPNSLPLSP